MYPCVGIIICFMFVFRLVLPIVVTWFCRITACCFLKFRLYFGYYLLCYHEYFLDHVTHKRRFRFFLKLVPHLLLPSHCLILHYLFCCCCCRCVCSTWFSELWILSVSVSLIISSNITIDLMVLL